MEQSGKKFLTIKEAAKLIGVTELTLRNWDKTGKFVAARHPMNNYRVYTINQVENLCATMERIPQRTRDKKQGPRKLAIKVLDEESINLDKDTNPDTIENVLC